MSNQVYYQATVPQFKKMMVNLLSILEKGAGFADAKKVEAEVLLNSRLAADQFPLIRQIQIATDTAKLCCSRITGVDAPVHDDKEKTFSELRTRIESVIQYLGRLTPENFKGVEEKQITHARWEGKYLMGSDFIFQHAIPNVYFHVTTAYAILRHNGVEIGKKDYLGEMPFKK